MIRIIHEGLRPVQMCTEVQLEKAVFCRARGAERLVRVRPLIRERRFARQELLYVEGQSAESLWVLGSGAVRLYKTSPDGRVATMEVLQPGEIFGAVSALDEATYPASAEAVSDTVAWTLPRSSFLRLLAEEPRLGVEILTVVTRRLHAAHERLRAFAHH